MTSTFRASYTFDGTFINADMDTAEEAAAAVERRGSGSVVEFHVSPNLPGRLPKMVHSSVALWTFEGGVWTRLSIHSGTAEPMGEERPGSNAIELRRLAATPFIAEVLTPFGYWNQMGRYRTAKQAAAANAKTLKLLPTATLRVRDEREMAAA